MAHIILKDRASSRAAQRNGFFAVWRNTGTQCTPGAHEDICVVHEWWDSQVKAFEALSWSHNIAVVKSEHDGVAAFGVKDLG